jgi:phage gp16-like protein
MRAIDGGGKKSQNKLQQQRNGLLAKIHIAINDLGIDDFTYREKILAEKPFRVKSAGSLTLQGLEALVKHFKALGWQERPGSGVQGSGVGGKESQVEALHERIAEIAAQMENGEKRANGLCKTICRTDRVEWCKDTYKLKRMLAIMEKIRSEDEKDNVA